VKLLQPVLGDNFLRQTNDATIGRLLKHEPSRLARLLYLKEVNGAVPNKKIEPILKMPDSLVASQAPGFAAWLEAGRARLEAEHSPLVFRPPPPAAGCGPGGGGGGGVEPGFIVPQAVLADWGVGERVKGACV
jgi:hypothetical protein